MGKISKEHRSLLFCMLLTLLWMWVIFWFSAQNGPASDHLSTGVLDAVLSAAVPGYRESSPAEQFALSERIHILFRKCGHFSEYTILGILLTATVRRIPNFITASRQAFPKRSIILPALCALLYAASDEFHQRFVPGRSCELRDVCIDFCGACLGILFSIIAIKLAALHRKKKQAASQPDM